MEENLYEDSGGGRCIFLSQGDGLQTLPVDRVRVHQMGKQAGQVTELTLLQAMYTFILASKEFQEFLLIDLEQVAEALPNVPIERQVGTILHATLDDHAA